MKGLKKFECICCCKNVPKEERIPTGVCIRNSPVDDLGYIPGRGIVKRRTYFIVCTECGNHWKYHRMIN